MNPESTIPCDIVLLPNEQQSRLAAEASQLLTPQGSFFTLDNQNFYAHASLYMFQMSLASPDACISALQQLAAVTSVQQLEQDGYLYQNSGGGKGYVDIAFKRNLDADSLQQNVVTTFNALRAGTRESDLAKIASATGTKRENLLKFGYPAIGEFFRPHITLTKFPVEIAPDLSVLPEPTIFNGSFDRIGLFEMGQNGTCIRKIAEFKLKI